MTSPDAPSRCPNCEAPLSGRYCSGCGQDQTGGPRSVGALISDLGDVLHFDSRALRTLARICDPTRTVVVAHSPPYGTACDLMHGKRSIGSHALRAFIERHQPPLTLHGHVHESPRLSGSIHDRLGETVCVNPGDSRRTLRAVLIDLDDLSALRMVAE